MQQITLIIQSIVAITTIAVEQSCVAVAEQPEQQSLFQLKHWNISKAPPWFGRW